jgi:UDP-glucose 4-epimerase
MRIVLTGGSSFTGYWFSRALVEAGHELIVTLSGPDQDPHYHGTRAIRIAKLREICEVIFEAPFGSDRFAGTIAQATKLDVLCHHWSEVRDYTSANFDPVRALARNVNHIVDLLRAFTRVGGQRLVLTGSVTEPNEGAGSLPLRAFWPYSLSKAMTANICAYYCEREGVEFRKFVIPNPFGPYEEARFTDYLLHSWIGGKVAIVQTPLYVRDNIHVDLLAKAYETFVADNKSRQDHFAPSGYVERQAAFTERVAHEMRERLSLGCSFEIATQTDYSQPMVRINTDPLNPAKFGWSEAEAWDHFAAYYASRYRH